MTQMFNQKILCLGTNSNLTDDAVSALANQDKTTNHGLISDPFFQPDLPGYYHTTVADLSSGEIESLARYFDVVVLLDQPVEKWSHPTMFSTTANLCDHMKTMGHHVIEQDPKILHQHNFFKSLLETNKSFCIYPFIHMTARSEYTNLCSRSEHRVVKIDNVGDWQTNPEYQEIRNKMLANIKIPDLCNFCYTIEKNGGKGARVFDTMMWAQRLNLTSLEDLKNIKSPVYYEIRPSNKCNLMCRSCIPVYSHLIDKEYKKIGLEVKPAEQAREFYPGFELVDFENLHHLYVSGGEPTVMPELYEFLRKCISTGNVNFDFSINTNANKISNTLLDLFAHFTNLHFSVSLDGFEKVNDYIRYPSDFYTVVNNIKKLHQQGHRISFISVVSIYNITSLYKLMEFQDLEFANFPVQLNFGSSANDILSPYNHPDTEMALYSLERCKKTKSYLSYSRGTKSLIDEFYNFYKTPHTIDHARLKAFFEFNAKLDQSRNQKMRDFIPELAKYAC